MVFGAKPGKASSKKLADKRKISLLNADFKILTGLDNKRMTKIVDHVISADQYALGTKKRIHHAINLARDAIFSASNRKEGVSIMDLDFQSAFDLLCMDWVYAVLEKKGLDKRIINRIKGYYAESYTIP